MKRFLLALALLLPSTCFGVVSNCTFYASPGGTGNGSSPSVPAPITSVASNTSAGSVICFMGGTYDFAASYSISTSGTSTNPVTWIAYGDSPVTFAWTGGTNGGSSGNDTGEGRWLLENSAAYYVINGINFVGNNYGNEAIYCASPGHHLTFENNTITGFIYTGVACSSFDYEYVLNNQIWLNGENPNGVITLTSNAGSGISLNQQTQYDSYTGLHCAVVGNVVTGQFDPTSAHTDGNGIILDLATAAQSGGCLIANNMVLMNGGIGIEINSGNDNPSFPNPWAHVAVVDNTVAYSGLDLSRNYPPPNYANINSTDVCYVNNISEAWPYSGTLPSGWSSTPLNWSETYSPVATIFAGNSSAVSTNLWYQSIEGVSNTLLNANPLFLNPPTVSNTVGGQYANAPSPSSLGNGMTVQSGSSAIGRGVDAATTCTNLPAQTITDMEAYIYGDIQGLARPHSGQNAGAYQGLVGSAQLTTKDGIECTKITGGTCSGASTVQLPDKFTLHDLSITRSGEYVIASPTGGEAANPSGNWNSGTLSGQVSNAVWTGSASLNINNGVWSPTATYSYHDVVVYAPNGYPGNFYTATSSVTVGCVPTNTTCWTQTEAYPLDYYYSANSLSVSPCTDFLNCNGHQAQGYAGKVYDSHYTYAVYSDPVINGLFNPGTNMLPSGLPCDFHGSWNQAGTTDSTPIGIVNTCVPAWPSGYAKAGYGEIEAVKPDGSGTTYRFAHDYNTGSSPYFSDQNNIGVISYLGDLIAFGTDMMGTRGDDNSSNAVCANPVRGMYQPSTLNTVNYQDTMLVLSTNYVYQGAGFWNGSSYITTGTGTEGSSLPNWAAACGTMHSYCTTDGTTGTTPLDGNVLWYNVGQNSCRSDIVIVDTLSAHAAP